MVSNGETFVIRDAEQIIDSLYELHKDRIEGPLFCFPSKFTDAIIDKHEKLHLDEKFVNKLKQNVTSEFIAMYPRLKQRLVGLKTITST